MDNKGIIEELVQGQLESIETIRDDVLIGEKRYGESAYAKVFLAFNRSIEEWDSKFDSIQEDIISPYFFDYPDSIKRNIYLYLVLDDDLNLSTPHFKKIRQSIEQNKRYARKYVVTRSNLKERLDWFEPGIESNERDSLSIQVSLERALFDHGIGAILDESIPINRLVDCFVDKEQTISKRKGSKKHTTDANHVALHHLDSIEINQFRAYPKKKSFSFSKVNLITGPNGCGKTSLLEAIELFYCGNTLRGQNKPNFEIVAYLKGDRKPVSSKSSDPASVFKTRNLAWYGQHDLHRSSLPESFSQFNFLNADAAFKLMHEQKDPTEVHQSLEKLIAGERASVLWTRINRAKDEVISARKRSDSQIASLKESIQSSEEELKRIRGLPKDSDGIFGRLQEMLRVLRWKRIPASKDNAIKTVSSELEDLFGILASAKNLSFPGAPVYVGDFKRAANQMQREIGELEVLVDQWQQKSGSLEKSRSELSKKRDALSIQKEFREYFTTGFIGRFQELDRITREIEELVALVDGLNIAESFELHEKRKSRSLNEIEAYLRNQLDELAAQFNNAVEELETFRKKQSEIISLSQELRHIARKILDHGHSETTCPLCASSLPEGSLSERLATEKSDDSNAVFIKMQENIDSIESRIAKYNGEIEAVHDLQVFLERRGLAANSPANDVLKYYRSEINKLKENIAKRKKLKSALSNPGGTEMSVDRLQELSSVLSVKISSESETKSSIEELIAKTSRELEDLESGISALYRDVKRLGDDIRERIRDLGMEFDDLVSVNDAITELSIRKVELVDVVNAVQALEKYIELGETALLEKLTNQVGELIEINSKLKKSIKSEMEIESGRDELSNRIEELSSKVRWEASRRDRIEEVLNAMELINSEFSLEKQTAQLAREVESLMKSIFSKIHSPHEYVVEVTESHFLKNIDDNSPRWIEEISTGQRAAFALAVFLSLNSSVSSAPRLLIMDDPIAHIDDLNALSFIDLLRELAISGGRQIFFATADDRVADMIRNKFEFMGDGFREIELSREMDI